MECMCTQTRPRFILSSERVLESGVRTHVNSKEKNLYRRRRGGSNPRRCITQVRGPSTLLTELFRPPYLLQNVKGVRGLGGGGGGLPRLARIPATPMAVVKHCAPLPKAGSEEMKKKTDGCCCFCCLFIV